MLGNRIYRTATALLSLVMVAIGAALLIEAASVNASSTRLLAGVLFLAAGVGRLYILVRRGRRG
jgi:fucose permease